MKMTCFFRGSLIATSILMANSAISAQPLTRMQADTLERAGTISASGAYSLSDLERKLKCLATKSGSVGYIITGVTGNNLLHGTATLYR